MKKLLLVLMALLLTFSLIACGDDETAPTESSKENKIDCAVHFDGNGDNKCDNCGEATETKKDNVGVVLAGAVAKQFENANTLTLEVNFNLLMDKGEWLNGETLDNDYLNGIAKFTITAAKTENGCNIKVDADVKSKESKDGAYEIDMNGTVLYVVDNMVYSYVEELDAFSTSELELENNEEIAATKAMLEQIFAGVEISQEEIDAVINQLGGALLTSFNIKENKGSMVVDLKPTLDKLISYISAIDPETKTLGDVLNDILAHAGDDVTYNDVLLTAKGMLSMTVSEYIEFLNASLTEAYGMNINELYASIMADEQLQGVLVNVLMSTGEFDEADAKAAVAAYAALEITEMIPAEMMDVVVYDLVMSMMAGTDEDGNPMEYPTIDDLEEMARGFLAMTVSDFAAFVELPIPVEAIIAIAQGVKINALNSKLDVKFQGAFQLEYIESTTTVDFVLTVPSGYAEGNNNSVAVKSTLIFKFYNISTAKTEIKAPTNIIEQN